MRISAIKYVVTNFIFSIISKKKANNVTLQLF